MPQDANISETNGGLITVGLPKARQRSPNYPFAFLDEPVIAEPNRPEPTYTFWKHPNDTFPLGSVVYFIYCAGRIKIGITTDLRRRLEFIQRHSPHKAVALLLIKGTPKIERFYHAKFADDRVHGEWFAVSKAMRTFLKGKLCAVGRASLKKADADLVEWIKGSQA